MYNIVEICTRNLKLHEIDTYHVCVYHNCVARILDFRFGAVRICETRAARVAAGGGLFASSTSNNCSYER
eukprot:m.205570 g.205570  ORF g.205570 m.205570 type:complete len:70 (-) comp16898_c7_seq1:140-349(-)